MGIFGFVLSGGGVAGVLAGGILTDLFSWHWIFLVNIPVGAVVFALSLRLLPATRGTATGRLDVAGADDHGRPHARRLRDRQRERDRLADRADPRPAGSGRRARPGVPGDRGEDRAPPRAAGDLPQRQPLGGERGRALLAAGLFAYFFFSALYMQQVLDYSPLEVGLAYLARDGAVGRVVALLGQARDALRSSRRCSRGWA